jgi:hypothetical protein
MLALVWGACGGGGGGGGGSPTSPGGGVAPPTGSITGNLQGTVVGFENPSTSFSGSTVELVGLATTTINGSNEWGFDGVSAGAYTLVFRGAGHLERRMRVNVLSNGISRFSNLELVEPGPFRLDNFDDVYRSFSTPGTIRWKKRPKRVLLDKKSLGDLPQGFDFFESAVREAYSGWLPAHTNGFFSGTKVQSGSIGIGDSSEFSCDDVENGDIVIVGLDECAREDMFITLGTATHCFNTEGNEVVLGAIWFNPCTTESTIKHEIIHTLCAEHLDMEQNNSIMAPSGGPDDLTQWDERWLRYLYSRQPGTRSPDNEPDNQNPD